MNTEDDQPVPVTSAEDGIRALGIIFTNQLGEGVLTLDAIEAEQEKLNNTVNEVIPAYEQKVSDAREAALEAQATVEALKAKKSLNSVEKRKLAEAEGVQANFKALNDTLNQHRENVSIMEENIASSIKANADAQLNGDNMVAAVENSNGFRLCTENTLKRTPKDFPTNHKYDNLLRLKDFGVEKSIDPKLVAAGEEALLTSVLEDLRTIQPLVEILNRAINYANEEMV